MNDEGAHIFSMQSGTLLREEKSRMNILSRTGVRWLMLNKWKRAGSGRLVFLSSGKKEVDKQLHYSKLQCIHAGKEALGT